MPRARNIKPGFAKNEDLAECSVWARLCFALLSTIADREGRLEDRPKRIKGELFPFDTVDVEPLLCELEQHGFIARYVVNGLGLIQIISFRKHQNPHHREPESTLPPHPSLGLDADGKYTKPQAPPSSQPPEAPDKPRLLPPRSDLARGSSRADTLIPEPGFRSPDSGALIPEEPAVPVSAGSAVADADGAEERPRNGRGTAKRTKEPKPPPVSAAAWEAYAEAYGLRYGAEPVRNAQTNAHMAQLVGKLGMAEAPEVARFFVGHPGNLYAAAMHPTNMLVRDAEKLRTEWATGRTAPALSRAMNGNGHHAGHDTAARDAEAKRLLGFARLEAHDA